MMKTTEKAIRATSRAMAMKREKSMSAPSGGSGLFVDGLVALIAQGDSTVGGVAGLDVVRLRRQSPAPLAMAEAPREDFAAEPVLRVMVAIGAP
jgi:hypothetical protein